MESNKLLRFLVWQAPCLWISASPQKHTEVQMWLHALFTCTEASLLCILMLGTNTITRQIYSHLRVRNLDGEVQKTQPV